MNNLDFTRSSRLKYVREQNKDILSNLSLALGRYRLILSLAHPEALSLAPTQHRRSAFDMPKLKKGTFSIFPHEIAQGLHPIQQTVLFWLWKYSNNETGTCFPSIATLAKNSGASRSSVVRALNELVEIGLVKKTQRKIKGKKENNTNLYEVVSQRHDPHVTQTLGSVTVNQRTKRTELNPINQTKVNTPSKEGVSILVEILFNSNNQEELAYEIEKVLPKDWNGSWKQTLCAAFGNFKTVREIWQFARLTEDLAAFDPEMKLNKATLNQLHKMVNEGNSYDDIKRVVKEYGWEEAKYEHFNDFLVGEDL